MTSVQPLPPTGLQRQAASLRTVGPGGAANPANPANPTTGAARPAQGQQQGGVPGAPQAPAQPGMALPATMGATSPSANPATRGSTSLSTLANQLARNYGLPIGQNGLVDEQGNFLMTPDQVAQQSGGQISMGAAAARFNLIADAIQRQQQQRQQTLSVSALQAGLGQVQQRGRGSLAAMQSGMYQSLSNLYQSQNFEAADFSYFIQKEQLDQQQSMLNQMMRLQKKKSQFGMLTGLGLGVAGIAMGNPGLAVGGFAQAGGNAAGTGWF